MIEDKSIKKIVKWNLVWKWYHASKYDALERTNDCSVLGIDAAFKVSLREFNVNGT